MRHRVLQTRLATAWLWNLAFLSGIFAGAAARVVPRAATHRDRFRRDTVAALQQLGLHDLTGLAPREVFSWGALLTLKGFVSMVVGGFLVGFGTAYAGGCTSGHAIAGLADGSRHPSSRSAASSRAAWRARTCCCRCSGDHMTLVPYFLLGGAFGIVLVEAEVVSWFRIQEMFRFDAFHMYGIIGTAVSPPRCRS